MSAPIEAFVPKGWRFHAADFSLEDETGTVMLKRNRDGVARWLMLSEEQRASNSIWAYGTGLTIEEALYKACSEAIRFGPMPEIKPYKEAV